MKNDIQTGGSKNKSTLFHTVHSFFHIKGFQEFSLFHVKTRFTCFGWLVKRSSSRNPKIMSFWYHSQQSDPSTSESIGGGWTSSRVRLKYISAIYYLYTSWTIWWQLFPWKNQVKGKLCLKLTVCPVHSLLYECLLQQSVFSVCCYSLINEQWQPSPSTIRLHCLNC